MSDQRVHKAVIPAAGLGTRFLPATKAQAKEMLPIVDRPTIQYVVEEAVRAGVDDVLIVTSPGKQAIEDHFDRNPTLEQVLESKGKLALLEEVRAITELAHVHTVRQHEPLGLGHAILQARNHVGSDSFAVLLGDDIIDPDDKLLDPMIELHIRTGRAVVAVMEVPPDRVDQYGVVAAVATEDANVFETSHLVEKPAPADAPSNLAIIGRYVLPGEIFDIIAATPPGRGDEIQITDALATLAEDEPILAYQFTGTRHDAGEKLGFLQATVDAALRRADLGGELREWLRQRLADGS